MSEIINRVAQSGLVTFDIEELYEDLPIEEIDLKDLLFHGIVLREKDVREYLDKIDLTHFQGKYLAVFCSEDIIIPQWAYMLFSGKFSGIVKKIFWGTARQLETELVLDKIRSLDPAPYQSKRIMVKGCSNKPVTPQMFFELVEKLKPVAQSLMYGEACSAVPVYKKPKT